MSVIAAVELHDLLFASIAPGETDGAHGGLCARVDKAYLFYRGHTLHYLLGQGHLTPCGCPKACAAIECLGNCCGHVWVVVAQDHGPPGTDVVDIGISVHIVYDAAIGPVHEDRVAPDRLAGAHRTVHATRDELLGLFEICC